MDDFHKARRKVSVKVSGTWIMSCDARWMVSFKMDGYVDDNP